MNEFVLCPARSKIEGIETLFRDFRDTAECKSRIPKITVPLTAQTEG